MATILTIRVTLSQSSLGTTTAETTSSHLRPDADTLLHHVGGDHPFFLVRSNIRCYVVDCSYYWDRCNSSLEKLPPSWRDPDRIQKSFGASTLPIIWVGCTATRIYKDEKRTFLGEDDTEDIV
mmetsp:Transcript_39945/g.59271  ORF Transcript_39945/g.59271 Transcript_39945/m.59271 type:complete len:123 (+) Transcript_39945:22-390(+)